VTIGILEVPAETRALLSAELALTF